MGEIAHWKRGMYNVRKARVGICEYKQFKRDRETESCIGEMS
jgi:hypothetical protein